MALSGSFSNGVQDGHYNIRVDWTASQSVANNTSTITAKVYFVHDWEIEIGSRTGNTLTIAGTEYTFSSPAISASSGTHLLATITTGAIAHNSDGTKSVSMACTWRMRATITTGGQSTYYSTISASTTATLDTIARASQPSCVTWPEHTQDVGNFGDTISIHMNRKSSSFTHTVRYAYGSLAGTIATGVTTGTTWTIPLSFMDLIPSHTSGSGYIFVDTYNGSTKIGTKYCGFTATVPDSVRPTCSLTVEDVSGCIDTYGYAVQGISRLKLTATGTPAYSSPIQRAIIMLNGWGVVSGSTTDPLTIAGANPLLASVVDARGRSSMAISRSVTVKAYSFPSITKLAVHRCDEDGTENEQGEYIKASFSATVTALDDQNTASYTLRYKKTSDSAYTEVTIADLSNVYTVSEEAYIFSADGSSSYDVELEVTDNHGTTTRSTSASTAFTLMNWGADGTSMAFGKVAEQANTLEIALDVEFIGKVKGAIFDAIYPVGSIYIAYNHTDPGTLFGGTWARLENCFLWAIDEDGGVGVTGGSKTHTLTVDEMPAHNHGGTYTNAGTARTHAWLASGGSAMGYESVDAGGGRPHNNMPPYIQVSMWRRTA